MFLTALTQERGHVQIQLFMDLAPRLAEQPQHCQQWRLLSDHRPKNEGQRVLQWDQCLSHILCPGRGWHDRLCRWVVSRACCLCDTKIVGTDKISKLRKHDEVSFLRKDMPLQWLDVRRIWFPNKTHYHSSGQLYKTSACFNKKRKYSFSIHMLCLPCFGLDIWKLFLDS